MIVLIVERQPPTHPFVGTLGYTTLPFADVPTFEYMQAKKSSSGVVTAIIAMRSLKNDAETVDTPLAVGVMAAPPDVAEISK